MLQINTLNRCRVSSCALLKLMGLVAVALLVMLNQAVNKAAGVISPITNTNCNLENKLAVTREERQFNRVVTEYDLHLKKGGWYVEVGGLDGERGSNTLWLEAKMGWQGLLIEMDPFFYTMLKGHNRHAWSINACLSPYNYPIVMKFKESEAGGGQLVDEINDDTTATSEVVSEVPCFPLYSIMLALNQTKVDYFSLDVEGFELNILRSIPYDKLDITTFSVEYLHSREGRQAYLDYMNAHGYRMEKDLHEHNPKMAIHVDDYIFVKNI